MRFTLVLKTIPKQVWLEHLSSRQRQYAVVWGSWRSYTVNSYLPVLIRRKNAANIGALVSWVLWSAQRLKSDSGHSWQHLKNWSINKILQFQANKHLSKRAHFHAVTFTVNKQEWTARPGNMTSISGGRKRCYSFRLCPDRFWSPRNLFYNGQRRLFHLGYSSLSLKLTTVLYLGSKLKICGTIPSPPHKP
jgi:hypothetical protein